MFRAHYIYIKTKNKKKTQEELLLEEQKQVGPDAQIERNRLRYFVKASLMRWRVLFLFFPLSETSVAGLIQRAFLRKACNIS